MGVASRSGAHHLLNYCSSRGCVGSKRKPRCIPAISCPRERLKHRVECACIRDYAKSRDGVTERISLCLLFSLSFRALFSSSPLLYSSLPSSLNSPLSSVPSDPQFPRHQNTRRFISRSILTPYAPLAVRVDGIALPGDRRRTALSTTNLCDQYFSTCYDAVKCY